MNEPTPPRVLVVDDDDAKRYVAAHTLRAGGFDTFEGATGIDALRLAPAADLVVLDVRLPDANGFDLCRRLKSEPATARTPVLLMSATFTDPDSQARGLDSGADAYLTDGAEPSVLQATARTLLRARRATDALAESEGRLRLALSAARMGIWTWDPVADVHTRDANLNRLLGLEPAETSHPLAEFLDRVHPDDRGAVRAEFGAALREGRMMRAEFRVVWPDGAVRWLHDRGDTFRANRGTRMTGAVVDVTDRRRAEEAVRESEERLRLVLESATDFAILTLDPSRAVTSWSPGAALTFGYAAEEILGESGDVVFTPEDRAAGEPLKEVERARHEGRAADERWHVRKDGSRFYASGVLTPLGDLGRGFVKVLRDLTERKRMDDELRAARDGLEARVAERTADLAAALESLESEMARRADLARRLATAQEDERQRLARDLHDTVGQTLTGLGLALATGRLDHARELNAALGRQLHEVAVRLRPTVLDDVGLDAAARVLAEEWSQRMGVPVEFQAVGLDGGRLSAEVETALYRVVQEALTNVAKHARASRASVVVGRREDEAVAVVEDDGSGFDPEAVRTPTPGQRGGLGLAGMRERVALLGGGVEVESAPGEGTTVFARIPLCVPPV